MARYYLPIASDRDRISAAKYASERLFRTVQRLATRQSNRHLNFYMLDGAVVVSNTHARKSPLAAERVRPERRGSAR